MIDKMRKMSASNFDQSFVTGMVKAYKADDALFTKEASSGQNSDIKAFAGETDETIKMHLTMIENIQSEMK